MNAFIFDDFDIELEELTAEERAAFHDFATDLAIDHGIDPVNAKRLGPQLVWVLTLHA